MNDLLKEIIHTVEEINNKLEEADHDDSLHLLEIKAEYLKAWANYVRQPTTIINKAGMP